MLEDTVRWFCVCISLVNMINLVDQKCKTNFPIRVVASFVLSSLEVVTTFVK